MSTHETLGLLLVRDGIITRPQLYDALRLQRQNNRLLGTCLLALGYIDASALLNMLSKQLAVPALPPGTLGQASKEAVGRVPRELAWRLRIVPYSWDGEMLGVAVADGRVLNHLHEVAYHTRSAVGAYVALEMEIESVLKWLYPDEPAQPSAQPVEPSALHGRPRPASTEVGSGTDDALSGTSGVPPSPPSTSPPQVSHAPPPAAPPLIRAAPPPVTTKLVPPVERTGFLDAVENIYGAQDKDGVATSVAQGLLNYFTRVLVLSVSNDVLTVAAHGGLRLSSGSVPARALPLMMARRHQRQLVYGPAALDPRTAELTSVMGFEAGATSLFGAVGPADEAVLLVFADNGELAELYEELHDVEMLFKEAETGLSMLAASA